MHTKEVHTAISSSHNFIQKNQHNRRIVLIFYYLLISTLRALSYIINLSISENPFSRVDALLGVLTVIIRADCLGVLLCEHSTADQKFAVL